MDEPKESTTIRLDVLFGWVLRWEEVLASSEPTPHTR
jgi:hypothetical protein